MSFKVYVPARYASSRLPGKLLLPIGGRPMLALAIERAQASGASEVVVAADDERIARLAERCGASVCLTDPALPSGTDRIAAAAAARGEARDRIIVNLQGDEPFMPAAVIAQVAGLLDGPDAPDIATVCEPLSSREDWENPNVVKVARAHDGRALYFSRAPIPFLREGAWTPGPLYRRHVGLYAYTVGFLQRYVAWPPAAIEEAERLEQLRALAAGARILVPDAVAACGIGVDTPADLARADALARSESGGSAR
ncbi:MAG TPA: 3-deoxy-manno-octulosonate cytidylyltransferase [Gammaproteobacteria bacterium]|nr:3-deoxy-manno-octulosonate cytidylyltransferase [Gammaproteobacteria bacterium]